MRIELWSVGKVKNQESIRWMQTYQKRTRNFHPIHLEEIHIRERSTDPVYLKKIEGKRVLERLGSDDLLILWDEAGVVMSSPELAQFLEGQMLSRLRRMIFLIGGAFGFDRSEEHTSELQSRGHLVCRLLLEKKKKSS